MTGVQTCALPIYQPDFAEAHYNRAQALFKVGRHEEALAANRRALELNPQWPEALNNHGLIEKHFGRRESAFAYFDRVLALAPRHGEALNNRGIVLGELRRDEEAVASFDRALAVNPKFAAAHFNRGNALLRLRRFADAATSYQNTLAADPHHPYALGCLAQTKLVFCDWNGLDAVEQRLRQEIATDGVIVSPFSLLALSLNASECLRATRHFAAREFPVATRIPAQPVETAGKLRIAYICNAFRDHATMALAARLFETHDRSRFETIGISYGPDDEIGRAHV